MKKVLLITCPIVFLSAYSNSRALIFLKLETETQLLTRVEI